MEIMVNENLIANLEQSLRQTRNQQNRLIQQLREAEAQADTLRGEIAALENSAAQTGEAIYSILSTMGTSNKSWGNVQQQQIQHQHQQQQFDEDDYNLDIELKRNQRVNLNKQNYNNHNNSNNRDAQQQHNQNNSQQGNNNYRNNPVAYINPRSTASNGSHIEKTSSRFADRTITQACTLLLREATSPLHVNELYNLLVSGGFEFKGNNPTISIAVSLNRNRRFRKVAPGTFELLMRDASQAAS